MSASNFWDLFIECARCSHIVPRHLYPYKHQCSKRAKGPSSNVAGGDSADVDDDLGSLLEEVDDAVAQDYPDEDQVNAGPPLAREAFDSFDTDEEEDDDSVEDDDRAPDDGWDSDLPTVLSLFQ